MCMVNSRLMNHQNTLDNTHVSLTTSIGMTRRSAGLKEDDDAAADMINKSDRHSTTRAQLLTLPTYLKSTTYILVESRATHKVLSNFCISCIWGL